MKAENRVVEGRMDFNGPGTSLFQGGNFDDFESDVQREEEEEAIEDQRRRDIELKNILENAFNDVSFDNEDCSGMLSLNHSNSTSRTTNTSGEQKGSDSRSSVPEFGKPRTEELAQEYRTPVRHSRSIRTKALDFSNHGGTDNKMRQENGSFHDVVDASGGGGDCIPSNHMKPNSLGECGSMPKIDEMNALYQNAEYNSIEQLQILYEVRVREVHRLTELVDTMKNNHEIERNEYKRQLAIAAAEIERQKMSQSDMQGLVVASKEEAEESRKEADSLKRELRDVEESRQRSLLEVETSRATINDLERKLLAIEKGRKDVTALAQYEANVRELKERHAADLRLLQEETEKWRKMAESRGREAEEVKRRLAQATRVGDEDLAKKSEIIQRLSKQVEEAQERCEKLMKNSLAEDNVKLQMEGRILREENAALVAKIEALERNLSAQESEMRQYESLNSFATLDADAGGDDMSRRLREELFRALTSQKARRLELQALHEVVKKKDEQIVRMTEKEREFLAESAKFREDIGKHIEELRNYEKLTKLKEAETERLEEAVEETKREMESRLKAAEDRRREAEAERDALREEMERDKSRCVEEYLRFHSDGLQRVRAEVTESLRLELAGKEVEIESLKRELEEVKNLYVEVYNEKEKLLGVDVGDEVKRLQKELEKSRQRILDMDMTLRQQYQQEVEKLNGEIHALRLETERLRKEADYEAGEKGKSASEVEVLRRELEAATAEKNLRFLDCENMRNEHEREVQEMRTRYEITVQKLNKEIELMLTSRPAATASPSKSRTQQRNVAVQGSPVSVHSACTSPLRSPVAAESASLTKREVLRVMERLGAQHEEEMSALANKYKANLARAERKWRTEVEALRGEMARAHAEELDRVREACRTEMANRVEQEKKEAVTALITEWACEAQALKHSQAEAAAEVETLKAKYKSTKKLALRYKTYLARKVEHMRGEWMKVEEGYEKTLEELERNIRALVDVREDEVKAKVESITKAYEEKIERMRSKLESYEELLARDGARASSSSSSPPPPVEREKGGRSPPDKGPEKLVVSNFVRGVRLKDADVHLRRGKGNIT